MDNCIHTTSYRGFRIKIYIDEDAQGVDPRHDEENLSQRIQ